MGGSPSPTQAQAINRQTIGSLWGDNVGTLYPLHSQAYVPSVMAGRKARPERPLLSELLPIYLCNSSSPPYLYIILLSSNTHNTYTRLLACFLTPTPNTLHTPHTPHRRRRCWVSLASRDPFAGRWLVVTSSACRSWVERGWLDINTCSAFNGAGAIRSEQ